ncbi:hypothetical protein [Streptomyces noursei]|uniref:hypothetical protein n=2 Tax=Streptomyces noursei TaxID=1971 RepID=UPI001300327D|nr:hypothetical protein [Streptomyces noursei]
MGVMMSIKLAASSAVRKAATCGALAVAALTLSAAPALAGAPTVVKGPDARGDISYAACPGGTHLIGGGYSWNPIYTNGGSPSDTVDINSPSGAKANTWAAKAHKGVIAAYALCAKD